MDREWTRHGVKQNGHGPEWSGYRTDMDRTWTVLGRDMNLELVGLRPDIDWNGMDMDANGREWTGHDWEWTEHDRI